MSEAIQDNLNTESADGIGKIGFKRLATVIWEGKWTIGLIASIFIISSLYYTLFVAVPRYSATVQLVLEVRGKPPISFEDFASGASTEDESINTELKIMVSEGILRRLVLEMGLLDDSEFNKNLEVHSPYSVGNLRFIISNLINPKSNEEPSEEVLMSATIDNLRSAITAFQSRRTYILNISAITEDGVKSTRIANRLAEIYIEEQVFARLEATEYAVTWLSSRVGELDREVQDKQVAVAELQARTDIIGAQASDGLSLRAKSLRDRLDRAKLDLSREKARLRDVQSLFDAKRIKKLSDKLQDPILDKLSQSLESSRESLFWDRAQTVLNNLQEDIDQQEVQIASLETASKDISERVQQQGSNSLELYRLVQDLESSRLLYETFQSRLKETSVQLGLQRADSRILSMAKRSYKVSPRRAKITLFAAILGVFTGIGIVVLRTFGTSSFGNAKELEAATGYRVLGEVPLMEFGHRQKLLDFLANNPLTYGVEALRDIRTSILMANEKNQPQVIMQTSSVPGEGKTTVSIALCQSLASLGKRVLLVEADIRRMTLNEYFDGKDRIGNVVSVVSGEIGLADAVINNDKINIDVLLGGKFSGSAADFLSSEAFKRFLDTARSSYDYIILDTPPVLVVPDARIIARLVDTIVYNVKWDSTHPQVVTEGLRKFSSLGIRVTGVLLTQVDGHKKSRYGYNDYNNYNNAYYSK